jgi:hypothetical protein
VTFSTSRSRIAAKNTVNIGCALTRGVTADTFPSASAAQRASEARASHVPVRIRNPTPTRVARRPPRQRPAKSATDIADVSVVGRHPRVGKSLESPATDDIAKSEGDRSEERKDQVAAPPPALATLLLRNSIVPPRMKAAPIRRLPEGRSPRKATARRIAENGPIGMTADDRAVPIRSIPT